MHAVSFCIQGDTLGRQTLALVTVISLLPLSAWAAANVAELARHLGKTAELRKARVYIFKVFTRIILCVEIALTGLLSFP